MPVPSAPSDTSQGVIYFDILPMDGGDPANYVATATLFGLNGYNGAFTYLAGDAVTYLGVKKVHRKLSDASGRVVFDELPGNDKIVPAGSYWLVQQSASFVSKAVELAAGQVINARDVVDDDFPTGGSFTPPRLFFTTTLVRAATTANITIATALNNGDTLDGLTLATGDRVLVKNQTAAATNGIYIVGASPARATDFNAWAEFPGAILTVTEGTINIGTLWRCTVTTGGTLETTAITFLSFNGSSGLTIGTTAITSGTSGYVLYDNAGVVGELDLSAVYQAKDATLTAFAALTIGANTLTIGTGVDAFSQTTFAASTFPARGGTGNLVAKTITDFALTILDDADATAVRATIGAGTGSGTVTSASVTTANGVSATVATSTTTPAFTFTLGAITPSSVAATGSILAGTSVANTYAPVTIWRDPTSIVAGSSPGVKVAITASGDALTIANPAANDFAGVYSIIETGVLGGTLKRGRIWAGNFVSVRNHAAHVNGDEININNNFGMADMIGVGSNTSIGLQIISGSLYPDAAAVYVDHVGTDASRWAYGLHLSGIGDAGGLADDANFTGINTAVIVSTNLTSVQYGVDFRKGQYRKAAAVFGDVDDKLIGNSSPYIRPQVAILQNGRQTGYTSGSLTGGDGLIISKYSGATTGNLLRITDASVNPLFIVGITGHTTAYGTEAAPGSSGSAENGLLRINASADSRMVDFGVSSSAGWIQSRDANSYATNYALDLNPNGGSVTINGAAALYSGGPLGTPSSGTATNLTGASGITGTGTLTSGATGAGFTIALTTSTVTGNLPDARNTVSNTTTTSMANLATVGTVTSGTWSGSFGAVSGANLTTLNAGNISSGTLAAARGGTGVSNAGTFTNASNTTITGGGTIALGGFTATIPATGTTAMLAVANAFTAANTLTLAPAAATVSTGWLLTDTTAASSGNQQYSPALRFTGQGWKTTSTAASQSVDTRMYLVPIQGTANPTQKLVIDNGVNGGSFTEAVAVYPSGTAPGDAASGTLVVTGGIGASGNIFINGYCAIGSGGNFYFGASGAGLGRNGATGELTLSNGSGANITIVPSSGTLAVTGGVTVSTTLSVTGASTLTGGIVGTTAVGNATAGNVGQTISSLVAVGSAVSLTTATAANVTSISLTAGDWWVQANVNFTETVATASARSAGINTTSATIPTDGSEGYCGVQSTLVTEINTITLTWKRVNVSSTTTVYLCTSATFSAGTVAAFGSLVALRASR